MSEQTFDDDESQSSVSDSVVSAAGSSALLILFLNWWAMMAIGSLHHLHMLSHSVGYLDILPITGFIVLVIAWLRTVVALDY